MSGLPRQFWLIQAKRRCSILFHLLVPGGKWHTVIERLVSSANCWSSHFHKRTREPLLPPPSALTSRCFAPGYCSCPTAFHHRRRLSTAKVAVSWSIPTLTQPAFCPKSYTP